MTTNSTPGWRATTSNDAFNCSRERADHAGAQALSLAKFEVFRKSVAFVANGDGKAVDACRGDVDPYAACAMAVIGMLRRVRHELIDDQRG